MPDDIPWIGVQSSNISQWRYDPDTKVLEIQFNGNDATYSYDDVPETVAEEMKGASSVGSFFHNNIKNRYRFYKG
jgi:hypothetical protein